MSFRAFTRWLSASQLANRQQSKTRLKIEHLEEREVPSVSLASIDNTDYLNNKPLFIPVSNQGTVNGVTTFTATSDNPQVSVDVLPTGETWLLNVAGTDKNGQAFSGALTIRLFPDAAPEAVERIRRLTTDNFFVGRTFFRTIDDFVIQGGSGNDTGSDPRLFSEIQDEYNTAFTFNSPGMVAFANATDDANASQFFITDVDTPAVSTTGQSRPNFLNFNHTIFGQLTSGQETFERIIQGTIKSGTTDQAQNPARILGASIIQDKSNGVLRIQAATGFTGDAKINVTAIDGDNSAKTISFVTTATANTNDERPFVTTIPDVVVTPGVATSVTIPIQNLDGDNANLTYRVGTVGALLNAPTAVTASVDNASGVLTVTAPADFTGEAEILVGVRDNTGRNGSPADDVSNFDTQVVKILGPAKVALASTNTAVSANRSVLLTATTTGANVDGGTVRFLDGTTVLGSATVIDGKAALATALTTPGSRSLTAEFTPIGGTSTTATSTGLTVNVSDEIGPIRLTVAEVLPGASSEVIARRPDGSEQFRVNVFPEFTGGLRLAVADVTGDGQEDVVAVPRFGGGPQIQIVNGADGSIFRTFTVFEDTFRGGLYIDAKDGLNLGYAQILVGAGFTGGPRVSYYDAVQNKVVLNYFAYESSIRSGVTVALGDLRGSEQYQIITAPGAGGGPAINVYQAQPDQGIANPRQLGAFFAGSSTDTSGKRVGTGTLGNGIRNIQVFDFDDADTTADEFDPRTNGIFPT